MPQGSLMQAAANHAVEPACMMSQPMLNVEHSQAQPTHGPHSSAEHSPLLASSGVVVSYPVRCPCLSVSALCAAPSLQG